MHIVILREIREKHYFGTSVYIVDLTNIKKKIKNNKKKVSFLDYSIFLYLCTKFDKHCSLELFMLPKKV